MEAIGALDEASAALGLARATCQQPEIPGILQQVQRDLYHLMAEAAADPENAARFRKINPEKVAWLESTTDAISARITPPREFILPGETPGSGALALARTIVRRAERRMAALLDTQLVENPALLAYLNRLSSLCFALELLENAHQGKGVQFAKGE
jgi:cob(I)alamin adenosyltransferase